MLHVCTNFLMENILYPKMLSKQSGTSFSCVGSVHFDLMGLLQGTGPYTSKIKETEDDITATMKRVNELAGIKESDTGLAAPALWDIPSDKQALQTEEPLQVSP